MDLQPPGVFTFLDGLTGAQTGQLARRVEQLGYSALWFPETLGRESFSFASYLLSRTERLVIATGIVVTYAYEPIAIANATRTLAELYGDRFVLGLGVSNAQGNARRGIPYGKPLSFTREYLTRMKAVPYAAPTPQNDPPVVLAGMMPKMLVLAATQTQGTHTYFTVLEQIATNPQGAWTGTVAVCRVGRHAGAGRGHGPRRRPQLYADLSSNRSLRPTLQRGRFY